MADIHNCVFSTCSTMRIKQALGKFNFPVSFQERQNVMYSFSLYDTLVRILSLHQPHDHHRINLPSDSLASRPPFQISFAIKGRVYADVTGRLTPTRRPMAAYLICSKVFFYKSNLGFYFRKEGIENGSIIEMIPHLKIFNFYYLIKFKFSKYKANKPRTRASIFHQEFITKVCQVKV